MTALQPTSVSGEAKGRPRRPHPRIDQARRSWYFFRRNSLALIGLSVLVGIGAVAAVAYALPLPWYNMPLHCATDYGPDNPTSGYPGAFNNASVSGCPLICTYETVLPPNHAEFCGDHWYRTPTAPGNESFAGLVAPTWSFSPLSTGPLPLGALTSIGGIDSPSIYDMSSGLLRGSDWSLSFSVAIVGIGAFLGMLVGAVAGFFGGFVDEALMRLVDIFLSIPVTLFVVVMVLVTSLTVHSIGPLGVTDTRLFVLVMAFAAVWWPFYARLVRGQVLVVREQKYIEAARASGASKGRILFSHIIPNSVFPIFIQFSLDVGTIPLLIGGLVFLGFGPELLPSLSFPEWGNLASLGVYPISSILQTCTDPGGCVIPWWQLFFPGLVLFLYAISVNLLSDGMRDAFDPRLRR